MQIIYQDAHIFVLNKAQGLNSEEDKQGSPSALEEARAFFEQTEKKKPVFVMNVHRLDRPVSGVLLFARKPSALKILNAQFEKREVKKIYWAITAAPLPHPSGKLSHGLKKDPVQRKAIISDRDSKIYVKVELLYRKIAEKNGKFLWEITLLTGKYHQIRAQLAFMGCPLIGDTKYGSQHSYKENAIALHARMLRFTHPSTQEKMEMLADVPNDALWKKIYA
jgi:RluA family pseudouridine synthase